MFAALLLTACHSDTGVVINGTSSNDAYEDFDFDAMDREVIVASEPDPSLGFALPPNGRIHTRSGAVGSKRGTPFELACHPGQVLVGIEGHFTARIDKVNPVCVAADADGRWSSEPTTNATGAGTNTRKPFRQVCAANQAVVGITGDFKKDYPTYLQVHCTALDSNQSTGPNTQSTRIALNASGSLQADEPSTRLQCANRAIATGLFGYAQTSIERLGLTCFENPVHAGRWSSRMDWPHVAIHSVMLSDGRLLTYGTGGSGLQGAMDYNVWDPNLGLDQSSHTNILGVAQVDSFCSAATLLPESGDVLMSGGDARPLGRTNAGIRDAIMLNAGSDSVSPATSMLNERWYPTSTTLPNGDVLVNAGRDSNYQKVTIPEIYSPDTGEWRALPGADMSRYGHFYPRQFVIPDGRVFGITGRPMWMMSTEGEGSVTHLGQLPGYVFGASTTGAMYEPGKILLAGGISNHGLGSLIIDLTSGEPDITLSETLAEPRRAWATSVIMADGKLLMVGGSYALNDAVTASLGAEVWDPGSEQWSQLSTTELPRLYHSSAVLLMDGRVLLAGGGSPGPLNNRNAEIYSPPYLFDDNGALADRPTITSAPEQAAWGQVVTINTSEDNEIEKITLIKTGSVTHGFDMDQRFLNLDFTLDGNRLAVTMPASGNVAPPGFYRLFVHNRNGTPSIARMLNLSDEPAPETPVAPPPTTPPLPDNTLLTNGGFELEKEGWADCAAADATSSSTLSSEGNHSMKVSDGGCLYQEVFVQPGDTYTLSCDARGNTVDYTSLSLPMLDANFQELATQTALIKSIEFETVNVSVTAPANAVYGSATLYSEGAAHFDRCVLSSNANTPAVPPEPPVTDAENLLTNGTFEAGKDSWTDCSLANLTQGSADAANGNGALAVEGAGCLYQEFPVTPGRHYEVSCVAKSEGRAYSSVSLSLMDPSYTTLTSEHLPIGRNFYQTYVSRLFAPVEGRIGAVTLYSEDRAVYDDCSVVLVE